MTNQEAYDGIVAWFSKPDAVLGWDDAEGGCVYRGANGERCAVGCLMPDNLYHPNFEGRSLSGILGDYRDPFGAYLGEATSFLARAQSIHDDIAQKAAEELINGSGVQEFFDALKVEAPGWGIKVRGMS